MLNSELNLAVDFHGMPVRIILAEGTVAYLSQAPDVIADLAAQRFLAERGNNGDVIAVHAGEHETEVVMPPGRPILV